jgi:hypothetical protein
MKKMNTQNRNNNDKEYIFSKLDKNDLPKILNMAKDIILNNYADFLGQDIVNNYIHSNGKNAQIDPLKTVESDQ